MFMLWMCLPLSLTVRCTASLRLWLHGRALSELLMRFRARGRSHRVVICICTPHGARKGGGGTDA